MIFKRDLYIEQIHQKLAILQVELQYYNTVGRYDKNRAAENFFCGLLNILFGWKLVNANDNKKNFPGIDLIDDENHIVMQLSSTPTHEKIQSSISTFEKHTEFDIPYEFYMFVITGRQKNYPKDFVLGPYTHFTKDTNILDIQDLLVEIEKQKTTNQILVDLLKYLEEHLNSAELLSIKNTEMYQTDLEVNKIALFTSQKKKLESTLLELSQ